MKEHFCPAEQSMIAFEKECNWCGESEGSMNEIIEMARQAGFFIIANSPDLFPKLVAFANLVAAKEREEANARANALWTLMCKKMVAFEREACAKVCEGGNFLHDEAPDARLGKACAAAIRAREEG